MALQTFHELRTVRTCVILSWHSSRDVGKEHYSLQSHTPLAMLWLVAPSAAAMLKQRLAESHWKLESIVINLTAWKKFGLRILPPKPRGCYRF